MNSTVSEFRAKEATTRLQYILRVFQLNESSQQMYRVFDTSGTKFVGVLYRTQQGYSQVPFSFQ